MLKAILRIQWRASWHVVTALAAAAFALPIVSVRLDWSGASQNLPGFLSELELWGYFYPMLAVIAAIVIAVVLWAPDRRGGHVYAMLLPLPRWRYMLLRYVAGMITLLPVVIALWLGAMVALAGLDLPLGIRTFPHALAFKFALTLAVMFGFAFAFASASSRTLGIALRIVGLFLAVHVAVLLISPGTDLVWKVLLALAVPPGPFAPLGGRWMLIDA